MLLIALNEKIDILFASSHLIKLLIKNQTILKTQKSYTAQGLALLQIQWNYWKIFSSKDKNFFILISKNKFDKASTSPTLIDSEFTSRELHLGLKIDHTDSWNEITPDQLDTLKDGNPLLTNLNYIYNTLAKHCFIERKQYNKESLIYMPQWCFYLNGHGSFDESIAQINLILFHHLLIFLDKKILTKLLIIMSCNAFGYNAQKAILNKSGEIGSHKNSAFSFSIIIEGISDAELSLDIRAMTIINNWNKNKINLYFRYDFQLFSKNAEKIHPVSYNDLLSPLISSQQFQKKFPHDNSLSLFYILPPMHNNFKLLWPVITIDKITSAERTKPLSIENYMSQRSLPPFKDKIFIILNSDYIPFTLDIVVKKPQRQIIIATNLTGSVDHYIDTIITDFDIVPFANMFRQFYNVRKRFLIRNIINTKKQLRYKNIIISIEPQKAIDFTAPKVIFTLHGQDDKDNFIYIHTDADRPLAIIPLTDSAKNQLESLDQQIAKVHDNPPEWFTKQKIFSENLKLTLQKKQLIQLHHMLNALNTINSIALYNA